MISEYYVQKARLVHPTLPEDTKTFSDIFSVLTTEEFLLFLAEMETEYKYATAQAQYKIYRKALEKK